MEMIKFRLFAEQEKRETKLKMNKIGNALSKLAEHVDFAAVAAEIDEAASHVEERLYDGHCRRSLWMGSADPRGRCRNASG